MNFIVTGSSGFLGSHIINFIKILKGNILIIGRHNNNKKSPNIFLNINDINKQFFKNKIKEFNPDYLFHIAGDTNPNNSEISNFVNFELGKTLLDILEQLAIDNKVKCVFLGTAAEYGKVLSVKCPLDENSFANPLSMYGKSKAKQTKMALRWSSNKRKLIVLRPFSILGEGMSGNSAFGRFIEQIKTSNGSGLLRSGNLNVHRDFIDVNDLIHIMWKLINNKSSYGQIYNVCQGKPILMSDMVKYLISRTNSNLKISDLCERRIENDMTFVYGNNDKLKKEIGNFDFIHWQVSIDRIVENLK